MPSYFVTWLDKSRVPATSKTVRLNVPEPLSIEDFPAFQAALVMDQGEPVIGGRPQLLHVSPDDGSWLFYESTVPAGIGVYVLCLVGEVPYYGRVRQIIGDSDKGRAREIEITGQNFKGHRIFPESTIIRLMSKTPRTAMSDKFVPNLGQVHYMDD